MTTAVALVINSGVGGYLELGDNWEQGWQGPKGHSLTHEGLKQGVVLGEGAQFCCIFDPEDGFCCYISSSF